MEWEPNERDAWVADAQRWIGQIKGVLQCKIDLDDDGEISGVHVVAGFDREPRHIVRDVESLLKARLGIDVYYKKIGVVQVLGNGEAEKALAAQQQTPGTEGASAAKSAPGDEAPPADHRPEGADRVQAEADSAGSTVSFHPPGFESPDDWDFAAAGVAEDFSSPDLEAPPSGPEHLKEPPYPAVLLTEEIAPRIQCKGVGVLASDTLVRAEVQLQAGEIQTRGTREGPNHPESDLILVAEAALVAVGKLLADSVLLHLKEIRTTNLGEQAVLLVAVGLVEGRRSEVLMGACPLRHNRQQSVVFAVLDAVNRRLALYPLREARSEG